MLILGIAACGDMYDVHEKYLKMGEETYLGIASDLEANSGFNRIELKWKLNADPRINASIISWEGCETPIEVPISADRDVNDYISKIIDLSEGKYIFSIINKSETGKESLIQTISGEVYGGSYQAGLSAQGINSMAATLSKGVTIKWAPMEGCTKTMFTYTSNEGSEKTITLMEGETTSIIPDAVLNTEFKVTSYFKPSEEAIDEIPSLEKVVSFPTYYTVSKEEWDEIHNQYIDVDRTGWGVEANTEELTGEGAVNGHKALIDGDLNTFWHSQWDGEGKNPPLPHIIIFDMQQTQNILSIELARRKNNLDLKAVMFSISNDKENWTELGKLDFPNDKVPNAQIILLPKAVSGRYFRTTVTDSNNGVNASIAEIMFTMGKK